jgi:hypothetical protein
MKTAQHTNAKCAGSFQSKKAALDERNSPESVQLIELDVLDLGMVSGGFGGFSGDIHPTPQARIQGR